MKHQAVVYCTRQYWRNFLALLITGEEDKFFVAGMGSSALACNKKCSLTKHHGKIAQYQLTYVDSTSLTRYP